jgi:hypothetical protein
MVDRLLRVARPQQRLGALPRAHPRGAHTPGRQRLDGRLGHPSTPAAKRAGQLLPPQGAARRARRGSRARTRQEADAPTPRTPPRPPSDGRLCRAKQLTRPCNPSDHRGEGGGRGPASPSPGRGRRGGRRQRGRLQRQAEGQLRAGQVFPPADEPPPPRESDFRLWFDGDPLARHAGTQHAAAGAPWRARSIWRSRLRASMAGPRARPRRRRPLAACWSCWAACWTAPQGGRAGGVAGAAQEGAAAPAPAVAVCTVFAQGAGLPKALACKQLPKPKRPWVSIAGTFTQRGQRLALPAWQVEGCCVARSQGWGSRSRGKQRAAQPRRLGHASGAQDQARHGA